MSRFHFAYSLTDLSPAELAVESFCMLDAAIDRARTIEKAIRPRCIYVVDAGQSPHRPRAIVERGVLRWLKDCHRCKATGLIKARIAVKAIAIHVTPVACPLCGGMRMIEEDDRG